MRTLNYLKRNIEQHKEIVKTLAKYVKNNQREFFLGIRKNEIHLYIKGGSRFLRYNINSEYAYINKNYIYDKNYKLKIDGLKVENEKILKENKKDGDAKIKIEYILRNSMLDALKNEVIEYDKKSDEKVFKQKLIQEINNNSNYYAYDIEYRYKSDDDNLNKKCNDRLFGKYSQPDLMIISKPNEVNKVKIIIVEVKYQNDSFDGKEMGSGIVGHVGKFVNFINLANEESKIKKDLLEEMKFIMSFYKDKKLITNKNFTNIDYDSIKLEDGKTALQFCFILGGCNESIEKSFRKYLGIEDSNAEITVKNSLNKKNYPNKDEMLDFKYFCYDNDKNIKFDFEQGGEKILKSKFY